MYFVPLLVTPILSRVYEQSAFGEWGVFSSTVTIIGIGLCAGYENAIILSKNDNETRQLSFLNLIVALCIISILIIFFYVGKQLEISYFLSMPPICIIGLYLVFSALLSIFQNIGNLNEKYATMTFGNIIQGCSQAVFRILFGFCVIFPNTNGLILGTTIALLITTIYYVIKLRKILSDIIFNIPTLSNIKQSLIDHRNFPLYDAPAQLLSFAAFNLPIIILSLYFSLAEIGCYSMILQLLLIPMSFIGSAMGKVYYKQISIVSTNCIEIKRLTLQSLKFTSYISILPLLFIVSGGDQFIVYFLGSKWSTAGQIALCLAIWSFPTILTQPLLSIFRVYSKQSYLLTNNLIYFIIGISSIIITASQFHNMLLSILIFATIGATIKFILFLRIIKLTSIKITEIPLYAKLLWCVTICCLIFRLYFLNWNTFN